MSSRRIKLRFLIFLKKSCFLGSKKRSKNSTFSKIFILLLLQSLIIGRLKEMFLIFRALYRNCRRNFLIWSLMSFLKRILSILMSFESKMKTICCFCCRIWLKIRLLKILRNFKTFYTKNKVTIEVIKIYTNTKNTKKL